MLGRLSLLLVIAPVFTVTALLTIYTFYVLYRRRTFAHIPSPKLDSSILGHLPSLLKVCKENQFERYPLIKKWCQEHGPVIVLWVLHREIVCVIHPTAVKEILLKHPKCPQTYGTLVSAFGSRIFGNSLVTNVNHTDWKVMRKSINPAFSTKSIKSMMEVLNKQADDFISELSKLADGKTQVCMLDHFGAVTLDVIGKVAFNMDINASFGEATAFQDCVSTIIDAVVMVYRKPLGKWDPRLKTFRQTLNKSIEKLRETAKELFRKRQEDIAKGEDVPVDVITLLLQAQERHGWFTEERLLDEFVTIFIAGQETTATALSALLVELGRNPHALHRLQEEVDSIMDSEDDYITHEQLSEFDYLWMCLKETMRIWPPAPATMRSLKHETVLDGHTLPEGTKCLIPFWVLHMNEEYFPEPYNFKPERFEKQKSVPWTYLPFSGGPRNCIGQTLSQIEAKVIIAKFFKNFNFELTPNQSFVPTEVATIRPKDGGLCTLTLRKNNNITLNNQIIATDIDCEQTVLENMTKPLMSRDSQQRL